MSEVTLLPIKYVSQLEQGAAEHHNDCGAACGVMLVKAYHPLDTVTVDRFYDQCAPSGDQYLSASQIINALAQHKVFARWQEGIELGELYELLTDGKPLIALINYAVLVDAGLTERTSFRGAHFVVIVGADTGNIFIHDPYCTGTNGAGVAVPVLTWLRAWGSCNLQGNPNEAAIIPHAGLYEFELDEPGDQVRVTAQTLTVRRGPGVNWSAVGYVQKFDILDVYARENGWIRIGGDRWVSEKYTTSE